MEADLTKSFNVLDNVQTMLQRVRSSKSDKEIINTYKMGSEAIKTAFAENGINLDKVHDVIEDMQEIYHDQEEYEAAISEPLRGGAKDVDDAELEKELMEMMASNEVDRNKNGGDGGIARTEEDKKIEEMNALDRELEMRLIRLRSDVTVPESPQGTTRKDPRSGLTQIS
jgi:hypothetical protein